MNPAKLCAWTAFTNVVKFFLGKTKAPNHEQLCETLLTNLHQQGANMSIKSYLLRRNLVRFPESLSDARDDQGKRFYQDISHGSLLLRPLGCHHACKLLLAYQTRRYRNLTFQKISRIVADGI